MSDIDIKNLSKYKYVYEVYVKDKKIHHKRFPVIYANQTCLYFKRHRKEELSLIRTCDYNSYYSHCYSDVNLLYKELIKVCCSRSFFDSSYYLLSENKINYDNIIIDVKDKIDEFQKKERQNKINKIKEQIEALNNEIKKLQD